MCYLSFCLPPRLHTCHFPGNNETTRSYLFSFRAQKYSTIWPFFRFFFFFVKRSSSRVFRWLKPPQWEIRNSQGSERFKHTTRPYKVEDVVKLQGEMLEMLVILLMATRNPKANHPPFGCIEIKPVVNNGINYQPQLFSWISAINSMCLFLLVASHRSTNER